MRTPRTLIAAAVVATLAAAPAATPAPWLETLLLLACAPGYPGNTEQAQPTMDRFADLVAEAAELPIGQIVGEYHEDEATGIERIRADADIVVLPLPLYLKYGEELELRPLAQAVPLSGKLLERWSLVAATGRLEEPESMAGWELVGVAAYAPAFVRGTVLGDWGVMPSDVRLRNDEQVLAALRRAAAGENVAVLLDGDQTDALAELPFADRLEVVATSPALPAAIIASVGDRVDSERASALARGLLTVHRAETFVELLTTLRLSRFVEIDGDALERARSRYRTAT